MAVHSLTVKKIISRVRQSFPDASENYIMNLINEALVELGKYSSKVEYAKTTTVADQQWYTLSDSNSGIEVNKVFRCSILNSDGEYIRIPRLTNQETKITDTE